MQKHDYIEWVPEHYTGIEKIDDGHRQFVQIHNKLVDIINRDFCEQKLIEIMYSLLHYAEHHLINEEICYQGYEHFATHKDKHKSFAASINGFQKQLESNKMIPVCEGLIRFLSDWFHQHILQNDKEAIQFVLNKQS